MILNTEKWGTYRRGRITQIPTMFSLKYGDTVVIKDPWMSKEIAPRIRAIYISADDIRFYAVFATSVPVCEWISL